MEMLFKMFFIIWNQIKYKLYSIWRIEWENY